MTKREFNKFIENIFKELMEKKEKDERL